MPVEHVFMVSPPIELAVALSPPVDLAVSLGSALVSSVPTSGDDVSSILRESDGLAQYLLIFLLAAIPLIEILVVIPIGIALGLDPVLVGLAAFLGNVIPVLGLVLAADRVREIIARQRGDGEPSARTQRAKRLWERYGLAGLALGAPVTTGVHLAAPLAVGLGASRRAAMLWLTASIALWTIVLVVASVTGLAAISGLF